MQRMEMSSYVNEPPRPKPICESQQTERRCMQILLLSFGLLCLIQATLNITLRLAANSECSSTVTETQTLIPCETVTDTQTTQQCNQLRERVNTLARDKNRLEEKITELTTQISELNNQNQKLTRQNQDPTRQNQELDRQNQELDRQNQELDRQNQERDRQNQELDRQNQERDRQNQELDRQNQDLNRQKQDLITRQNQDFTRQNQELNNQNQELTSTQSEVVTEEGDQLQDPRNGVSVCLDGWKEIRGRCYFLSSERRSWDSSRRYCQAYGADLVVINDEQEQRDVYGMKGNPYVVFWIGLRASRGTFKWVDDTPLTSAFWQVGQPGDGGPNNQEFCVEVYGRNPVLSSWNDAPCGHSQQWICEKSAH